MTEKIILNVASREATGKQVAKLRNEGLVPGVVYGRDFDPKNIQLISQQEARSVVARAGRHTTVQLSIDGDKNIALIKSVDYTPTRKNISHISFQAVKADEVVTTEVPLILVDGSESPAAKAGMVILPALESVEVRAKTASLPEKLEIDASGLTEHGDKLTLADVKLPKGVELVEDNMDIVAASVYEPAALEAKNAADDDAADESRGTPEVPTTDESESAAEETATDKQA